VATVLVEPPANFEKGPFSAPTRATTGGRKTNQEWCMYLSARRRDEFLRRKPLCNRSE